MTELLFDVSWWIPLLVAGLGVAILIAGNNRQHAALRNAGGAVALLGVAWLALGFVIATPTKTCVKQSRQLAQAVADGDWKTFNDLAATNAAFHYVGRPAWQVKGRAALETEARAVVKQAGLHSASLAHVQPRREANSVVVAFTAFLDSEVTPGHPIDSQWEFEWQPQPDGWRLADMRVLDVANQSPESIKTTLNKH